MKIGQLKQIIPNSIRQSIGFLGNPKKVYQMKTSRLHPNPIFILGHAKSGTTVIASLLAKMSGQEVSLDPIFRIDPKGALQEKIFSQALSFDDFIQSNKFYFSTPLIKDPKLTFFYDDLVRCFPEARFAFVIRDPRDTIRSFLNRRGIPGNLDKLSDFKGSEVQIGRRPVIPGNNYIEKLANRWNLAAETYINHQDNFSLIRYEDFVQDKIRVIGDLAKDLGLNQLNDIAGDLNIQYQPIGDKNIGWLEFFGPVNLRQIETICCDQMNYFEYRPSPASSD
ncbi:MAG: sulfotransferase [Leptolyngbyaceae cyanobacterium MO_188.B28]|nr:sulfotransferase [Leptolyngbyaceae cyanobacterium MO_188.B28]